MAFRQAPTCVKCRGTMEHGFIMDHAHSSNMVLTWNGGRPQASFWTGAKRPKNSVSLPIGVYRCTSCGYLEFYADAGFAAEK